MHWIKTLFLPYIFIFILAQVGLAQDTTTDSEKTVTPVVDAAQPDTAIAASTEEKSLDKKIDELFAKPTAWLASIIFWEIPFTNTIKIPFILIWLVVGATFFTCYFRFINIRYLKLAFDVVRGKYTRDDEPGQVTHFQALSAALSATVGLGNIASVAVAIGIGGPGATFWMIVAGFLGMSSKFVECTLGVRYREFDAEGTVRGGPMYYLKNGLAKQGLGPLGSALAILFALLCIGGSLGGGNMFQVNQAHQQFVSVTGLLANQGWVFGLIMAGIVACVIIGGIVSIAKVTSKVVPFMCGIYIAAAMTIIITHFDAVPMAFGKIITEAFSPIAVGGGVVGVIIQGFKRAAFSNEAGIGSASMAHAAVKTENPASEGIVALLEPFIDTIIVCTMTALVIIITGEYQNKELEGVAMTSAAFASVIWWFPIILSVAVILFAFSTMISWSYYGQQAWNYLFGHSKAAVLSYKLLFCVFIVIGAASSLSNVLDFSDIMILGMAFPNIIGLYFLIGEVRQEVDAFTTKINDGTIPTKK